MTQTDPAPAVSYASSQPCSLCAEQPMSDKQIYGHPVCRKCYSGFANRRYLAYLIDSLLLIVPSIIINMVVNIPMRAAGMGWFAVTGVNMLIGIALTTAFAMKDGFNGQSPGKKWMDVQVLDNSSGRAISFEQSFKRNCFLLVGQIPLLGGLVALVLVLIIAFQLLKGYRLGDAFANTRVIWKKYATQPVFAAPAMESAFPVMPAVPTA